MDDVFAVAGYTLLTVCFCCCETPITLTRKPVQSADDSKL